MSETSITQGAVLDQSQVTLDDLFRDLTDRDSEGMARRLSGLATDVMLAEGAGTLVDAVAFIRVVARQQGVPGSDAVARMECLADELAEQATAWQQASDTAAIAIRAANKRNQTEA
jgi:hypothetical protein